MRLNSAPLNATTLGGTGQAIRFVRVAVSQVVRVAGALISPVFKHGRILCSALVASVVTGKRVKYGKGTSAPTAVGTCKPTVRRNVKGSGLAAVKAVGSMRSHVNAKFKATGIAKAAYTVKGGAWRRVYGVLRITVGINGKASGLATNIGPTDPSRTATVASSERVVYIQGV